MSTGAQQRTTAFVTAPIVVLAAGAFIVILASLGIGAREADTIALERQRETITHAIEQHGNSLGRELRVQTVWNEAYEHVRVLDQRWLHEFYGNYLDELVGYDRIYVLSGDDTPVYGWVDGRDDSAAQLAATTPVWTDLAAAVRSAKSSSPGYEVVTTPIKLGNGETLEHRAVADVRNVGGNPAMVVVSTIVPDHATAQPLVTPTSLLVAIEYLDTAFTRRLGTDFEFRDLQWISGKPRADTSTLNVKALDGSAVGTLGWRKQQPGWQFVHDVSFGLLLALALVTILAAILVKWGKQQAGQLLQSEAEARHAAKTDALTALPNRVALGESLPRLIQQMKMRGSTLGLLSIDVDGFKTINDDFGQGIGDQALLALANRLRRLLPERAQLVRLDGDEFMALIPGASGEAMGETATDLVTALAEPVDTGAGGRVFLTVSIGSALAPRDGESEDKLLRRVELALAGAKADGGATAVAFAPAMEEVLSKRRALEKALRDAVADKAIDVAYQPIMDARGTTVLGVEALARWTDPIMGPISPEIFISVAEEAGLIGSIGELVLRRALADANAWPGINLAVNISGAQIHHGDVVGVVREALSQTRFPPERLEIEVTESVLLADERRADDQIKGLQNLGAKVALDDFGSGYSSLVYLRKFGFDKLKIDRSFIEEIAKSHDNTVILASVIRLGLDLGMLITAEGIETEQQRAWLEASGCHQLQGYLFSHPLTAAQLTAFLATHQPRAAAS